MALLSGSGSSLEPPRAVLVLNEAFFCHQGRYYTQFNWWRFAEQLAGHFSSMTLYVPLAEAPPPPEARPAALARLKVEGRFFYKRMEEYYARILCHRRQMHSDARRIFADADVVLFRVPSPDALPLARVAWRLGKPTALLVGGDLVGGTAYAGAGGPKAWVARCVARQLRRAELRVAARSALVAVWGEGLMPVFSGVNPRTALANAPLISRDLVQTRDDTCRGSAVRLLRIARILPNKGLEYLLEAVAQLRSAGRPVFLDVVGAGDDAAYLRGLQDLAAGLGIADAVKWHGHLDFGPLLFDLYRGADIHVVSSVSEGVPRCIAEGRVFGLPTVATRVGGIPSVMHDGTDGLLAEPKSGEALAAAVGNLIDDGDLRRRIIREGYRLAQYESLEFQADRLATLISRALSGQPLGRAATDLHTIEA